MLRPRPEPVPQYKYTMSVAEWQRRKAAHAPDPVALRKAASCPSGPPSAGAFEARVGGLVVARAARCEVANNRCYFPLDALNLDAFEPSRKRWR